MTILGISGLFTTEDNDYDPTNFYQRSHDATACLIDNGTTLAAVEEERLNRDKHTFRFPREALKACFDVSGTHPSEVTRIAYYFGEEYMGSRLDKAAALDPQMTALPLREQLRQRVNETLAFDYPSEIFRFLPHHDTHAASAFYDSGMERALVVVSDGNAEKDGISVYEASDNGLKLIRTYRRQHSLGHFYTAITRLVGYRNFDEYKVMGLASFGNPQVYRDSFDDLYSLGEEGSYELDYEAALEALLRAGHRPRRADEPILQAHKDLAASAQEVLERISIHIISYWLKITRARNLCLAGGVAQNTSLNGKLLRLRELDAIFIPPAAHDGGAALGAAMLAEQEQLPRRAPHRYSSTAYLGCSIGTDEQIKDRLDSWAQYVTYEQTTDTEAVAARAIAANEVVAWVQGRAEFGPRALGNRSILADARPAANRDRVNLLIKKREDYRPFAPVVTIEDASRYFDLAQVSADHSYMGFVVPVRSECRTLLGAVTHVDGTARIQTIHKKQNLRYWKLLKEFEKQTGTPVLLNTSYNNSAEPIVQTINDAIATFITTGLDRLFIGDFQVMRRDDVLTPLLSAEFEMMPFCTLVDRIGRTSAETGIYRTAFPNQIYQVSEQAAAWIRGSDRCDSAIADDDLMAEIWSLWDRRLIRVLPNPG